MSELIQSHDTSIRGMLLVTASALALAGYIAATDIAKADDADRPTVWIELGGQLEALRNTQDQFTAPFLNGPQTPEPFPFGHRYYYGPPVAADGPQSPFDYGQPLDAQHPPEQSFGGEGKITFSPEDSNWVFSAAIRYGRSNGSRHAHQTTGDRIHLRVAGGFFRPTFPLRT